MTTHGGARNRSGPQPDPSSGRSERRGFSLTALPNEGYAGEVPELSRFLPSVSDRHEAIWSDLWATPQACAWAREPWRWQIVADLVEYRVRADDPEAPASWATVIRQLRDDLGLSAAGLKMNGWAIAAAEIGPSQTRKAPAKVKSSRDRLKVASGGG